MSGDSAEVRVPRARVMRVFLFTPALLQEQGLVDTVGATLVANSAGCGLGFAPVLAAQEQVCLVLQTLLALVDVDDSCQVEQVGDEV